MTDYDPRADLPVPNRRTAGGVRSGARPRGAAAGFGGPGGYGAPGGYGPVGGLTGFGDPAATDAFPRRVVEPTLVYEPPPPPRRYGDPAMRKDLGFVLFAVASLGIGILTWNLAGGYVGKFLEPLAHPVAVVQSASPRASASAAASPGASGSLAPSASPSATPAGPTPPVTSKPVRKKIDLVIEPKPAAVFASEYKNTWCAAAAVQIALNVNGPRSAADTSRKRQAAIHALEVRLTTRKDSRNGGAGPLGMVATLERLGDVQYELKVYNTREAALRASARAIRSTGHAAILLAWRGAHAWVMTGFRADADPVAFKDAKISGAYIIDPWYPRISRIWGKSDKPGVFQDAKEMRRNYLPWRRPEGRYPGRDGDFLVILPVD